MADQYTSIATTPGLGDNLVTQAYDLAVAWVLRETPQFRMFVSKRPERPTHNGTSIRLQKFDYFSAAAVTAAKTPLVEEADVDAVKMPPTTFVDLTPKEYGFVVRRTNLLKLKSMVSVDEAIARALATHQGEVLDELVQDKLDTATNIIYAGDSTSQITVDAADKVDAADVRKAVTKLRTAKALPWTGNAYAASVHPHVVHDLREETGSGSWRVPSEYGASQERIWKGEIGEFEGAVFYSNARTRRTTDGAASAAVYRTTFFGREGLAEAVAEEPHTVATPQTDNLRRFTAWGWYGVLDWAIYRQEALVQVRSGSGVASL